MPNPCVLSQARFFTSNRSFTVEGKPIVVESLEKIAQIFGFKEDYEHHHQFLLYFEEDDLKNESFLKVIELIWEKFSDLNSLSINIFCGDEELHLVVNEDAFAFIALALLIGDKKSKSHETIEVTVSEYKFRLLYDMALEFGLLPF